MKVKDLISRTSSALFLHSLDGKIVITYCPYFGKTRIPVKVSDEKIKFLISLLSKPDKRVGGLETGIIRAPRQNSLKEVWKDSDTFDFGEVNSIPRGYQRVLGKDMLPLIYRVKMKNISSLRVTDISEIGILDKIQSSNASSNMRASIVDISKRLLSDDVQEECSLDPWSRGVSSARDKALKY